MTNNITPFYDDSSLRKLTGFQIDDAGAKADTKTPDTRSPRRWTANPLIHLSVVASGVGLVCLCLMHVTGSLTLTKKQAPDPLLTTEEELTITRSGDDSGNIKTGLAYGRQSDDIAALADLPATSTASAAPVPPPAKALPVQAAARQVSSPPRAAAPLPEAVPPVAIAAGGTGNTPAVATPDPTSTEQLQTEQSEPPLNDDTDPAQTAEDEDEKTTLVLSGETVTAKVETPFLVAAGLPLKGQLRLTAPLTTPAGDIALATDTLLIAETMTSGDGNSAYFRVTSAIVNGEEYSLPPEAVLALGTDGLLRNDNAQPERSDGGINLGQALLTGGLAALDIEGDSLPGGIALDILEQLGEQETLRFEAALQAEETWEIAAGTELVLHVNQPLTLPAPDHPAPLPSAPAPVRSSSHLPDPNLPADASIPHSLIGFGSVPSSEVTVVLHGETGETISFLRRKETISEIFLDDPAMVALSYDRPLDSGEAGLIYAVLRDESEAAATTLNVVTETIAGHRRWHRFTLQRG